MRVTKKAIVKVLIAVPLGAVVIFAASALVMWAFSIAVFSVPTGSMVPTLWVGSHILADTSAYTHAMPHRGDLVVFWAVEGRYRKLGRAMALPGDTIEIHDNGHVSINGKELLLIPREFPTGIDEKSLGGFKMNQLNFFYEKMDDLIHPVILIQNQIRLPTPFASEGKPFLVPDSHIFVLGDNRDNSRDSRYWGPLPLSKLIGKITSSRAHGFKYQPVK